MSFTLPKRLASLRLPGDVPSLSLMEKQALAQEVRDVIIEVVSQNGGHLAPSLGAVELTIALLSSFNPAKDAIVWDVGHQTYPWKLLTGRAPVFNTLRKRHGLSGFPKMEESPYDAFGVGHASTSISAALGMAVARDLSGGEEHVVAVIGDGALTGGMALEALNLAGGMDKRLIVVLNDNEMSISENVGALSRFLSRNLSHSWVMHIKIKVGKALRSIPRIGPRLVAMIQRGESSFKTFFTPGMLFEAFRFNYIGPVNGHDIEQLTRHLEAAKRLNLPVLLHVRTRKGKGYVPAEQNPCRFHGISGFVPGTGQPPPAPPSDEFSGPGFSCTFGSTLCELGEQDPRIVVISAAMPDGTGTSVFQKRFPDRFVDVGICEEHAVTFAAGLARRGLRPVVAIYSTFMQRAYDQIIHDVCLQNLPVLFCMDRAGLVGEDGPTHHGSFDLSWLRAVPGISIIAPRDEAELRNALFTALSMQGPVAVRYPRGSSRQVKPDDLQRPDAARESCGAQTAPGHAFTFLAPGTGEFLVQSQEPVCVLTAGHRTLPCVEAARLVEKKAGHLASVFDARWVKPLPEAQILTLAKANRALLLVEENSRLGGFSSAVLELLADNDLLAGLTVRRMGLPDNFVPHGSVQELRAELGLNVEGIAREIDALFAGLNMAQRM